MALLLQAPGRQGRRNQLCVSRLTKLHDAIQPPWPYPLPTTAASLPESLSTFINCPSRRVVIQSCPDQCAVRIQTQAFRAFEAAPFTSYTRMMRCSRLDAETVPLLDQHLEYRHLAGRRIRQRRRGWDAYLHVDRAGPPARADITFALNITLDQLGLTRHEFSGKVEKRSDRRDRESHTSRPVAVNDAMAGAAQRALGLLRPDRHGNVSNSRNRFSERGRSGFTASRTCAVGSVGRRATRSRAVPKTARCWCDRSPSLRP